MCLRKSKTFLESGSKILGIKNAHQNFRLKFAVDLCNFRRNGRIKLSTVDQGFSTFFRMDPFWSILEIVPKI